MAITVPAGAVTNPADNSALYDSVERSIDPSTLGAIAGDLILWPVHRKNVADIVKNKTGGQTWNTTGPVRQSGSSSARIMWCQFNGTWDPNPANNPSIVSSTNPATAIGMRLFKIRPSNPSNTWAIDVAETYHTYNAVGNDVTAPAITTLTNGAIVLNFFFSEDNNTWSLKSGGRTNLGGSQYRVADTSAFKDLSMSVGYLIQATAGDTGSCVNTQATVGPDAGFYITVAFKEQSSGVTVASAGDALFYNGETGITITGTSFGASKGSGSVVISPTDNVNDGSAVTVGTDSWADTSIAMSAPNLSSFTPYTQLYLFVKNNGGSSNATGFPIKRESRLTITATLQNAAAAAQASITNIDYRVSPTSVHAATILEGTAESTDGTGQIVMGPYTLPEGGPLSPGDSVWVVLAWRNADPDLTDGFCGYISTSDGAAYS